MSEERYRFYLLLYILELYKKCHWAWKKCRINLAENFFWTYLCDCVWLCVCACLWVCVCVFACVRACVWWVLMLITARQFYHLKMEDQKREKARSNQCWCSFDILHSLLLVPYKKMKEKGNSWVDFINILLEAFRSVGPKSAKRHW
jgi:hypothetical protein